MNPREWFRDTASTASRDPGLPAPEPVPPAPARDLVLDSLEAACEAMTHQPGSVVHLGRLRWLMATIRDDAGDANWHAAGYRDGLNHVTGDTEADARLLAGIDPETYAAAYREGRDSVAVSLAPFQEVLTEVETRMRAFGGGVQDAYANCASMLRSAFAQYQRVDQ